MLKNLREDGTLRHNLNDTRKQMTLEEEFVVKQMESSFKNIPQEVIFYAVICSNENEWEKSEYWGGMLCLTAHDLTNSGCEGNARDFQPDSIPANTSANVLS